MGALIPDTPAGGGEQEGRASWGVTRVKGQEGGQPGTPRRGQSEGECEQKAGDSIEDGIEDGSPHVPVLSDVPAGHSGYRARGMWPEWLRS